jgi:hypothetical protein
MAEPPIDTKVLLGWFERDAAIRFLTNECVTDPQITAAEAEAIWRPFHGRVQALAERPRQLPTEYPLTRPERDHAKTFARKAKRVDPNFDRIIKVDLMELTVHQFMVLIERATNEYGDRVCTGSGWRKRCLQLRPPQRQIPLRKPTPNSVVWDIPHAEFHVAAVSLPNGGRQLAPSEWPKWVTVTPCDGRLMLWCGYHRSYARMANTNDGEPDGAGARSLPVVLVEKVTGPLAAPALERAAGLRPALFRDFFDDNLFFMVKLRRKRYELRATVNGNQFSWSKHVLDA